MNIPHQSRASLRRSLLLALLASTAPVTLAMAQTQAQEQVYRFDIPARPVAQAANQIGAQVGLAVVMRESGRGPVRGNAVRGTMSASQALRQLLAGTGLSYRIDGAGTVVIEAPPQATTGAAAEPGTVVLDTVTLTGSTPGTTEGTGSYTTDVAIGSAGLPLTIKETPQSVSVITNQRIADQGLQTTQQVLAYTTGVNSATYETDRDNTWARGQWVSSYFIDGVLVDAGYGFYAGTGVQSSTAAYDHIEVVRGANGLLTGTGDPSAAVRITRKQADARELTGSLETRTGTWNRGGLTLDVQSPLNADGTVRGRFVADIFTGDGFRDRYHVNRQTLYGTLAWDITPDTKLTASFEHRNHDPRGSEWAGWPSMFSDGSLTSFPRSYSSAPWWASWASQQDLATLRLDHDLGAGWSANATLSALHKDYTAEHMRFYGNPDPVTGEGLEPFAQKDHVFGRQIALDAQLGGPVQAFGREHVLNFGFHGSRDWSRQTIYTPAVAPVMGSAFDWNGGMARPDWVLSSRSDWGVETTQYAAFGSAKISITDPLTAVLGLRYTDWKADDRHFSEATPYIGLVYDLTPDVSLYASYTSIFNPQSVKDRYGKYLDPVQGKNKEVGIKGSWMEDRLNASLSWFHTYQDNVATEDVNAPLPPGQPVAYYGADGVSAKGIELEVSGEVRPGVNLFLGAATMKQKDAMGAPTMTSLPSKTAKLFVTWQLPGDWDKWTIGGGARWQNATWTDVHVRGNPLRLDRGGYTVADAMVRYDIDDRWSAQLNVNNVFDKTYFTGAANIATYGEPRNAMLSLVSRF